MPGDAAPEPIETWLARAGLPPLARLAWLEIDLDALRGNLAAIRDVAGPGVRVEPVVKADAYGHGAVPVALALEAAGADGVSVATLDEAFELRAAGVALPVLVLYPVPPERVAEAASVGIALSIGPGEPSAGTLAAAAAVARVAARAADRAGGTPPLQVHLEIETGLGRGGVMPADVAAALAAVRDTPGVVLRGVWTHLAAADDPGSAQRQYLRFAGAVHPLLDAVAWGTAPGNVLRHVAGSGGVLGVGPAPWEAVRPGIAIYGLLPDNLVPSADAAVAAASLRPVMTLKARPVRVADLPAGHGISYGPSFVTARPARIATIPVGYADGWTRALSDRASALVRGRRVPLVGRVAMDAVMADVTDVPGPPVTSDDEFVLLGAQGRERITALDLASAAGTISHEIVTGMSGRLARVYHAAGSAVGTRTLAGGRSEWRASSSGTATSANSRSMPS
jgi:alanine racemase